jgi:hypothetical protein
MLVTRWWRGVRRISKWRAGRINRVRIKGILLELIPSKDKPDIRTLDYLTKVAFHPRGRKFYERLAFWRATASNAFEIWSWHRNISFLLWSRNIESMRHFVNGVHVLYPNSYARKVDENPFYVSPGEYVCAGTIKAPLLHAFKDIGSFSHDPINYLLETLTKMPKCIVQVFFKPMELSRGVKKRLKAWREGEAPRFEVLIRYAAISKSPLQAYYSAKTIGDSLKPLEKGMIKRKLHKFTVPIFRDSLKDLGDIYARKYPRLWDCKFLLEPQELATLVHLPVGYRGVGIKHAEVSLTPPPYHELLRRRDVLIGRVLFRGRKLDRLYLSMDDVMRGQYIIGGSGTGKTVLLCNEILQVFKKGLCVHVLDPHGDMALDLLAMISPKDRDKVIFLDPLRVGFSLNPFEIPRTEGLGRELIVERLIGQIVDTMKRLFGEQYWGPSLNRTFQNALRTLYQEQDNPTFLELYQMINGQGEIAQKDYVKPFLRELENLPKGRIDAVLNKIEPFVKNRLLCSIFCNKVSSVDLEELIKPGRLVIWRLAKGELSETNMSLIGSGLVTKIWYHIISKGMAERVPLLLVADEFQNFGNLETLEAILTEGRKFKIGLALAHQTIRQIPYKIQDAVMGNTATKIVFRVSGHDSQILARSIYPQLTEKLKSLMTGMPDGTAIVKLKAGFGEETIPAFQIATFPPTEERYPVEEFIQRMRAKYKAPELELPKEEEGVIPPDILDLLKIVHSLTESGIKPSTSVVLEEFRKVRHGLRGSQLSNIADKAQSMGLLTRKIVRQERGRPKIVFELTEKGLQTLGIGVGLGASTKAGGELHRAMILKLKEYLSKQGYLIEHEEQAGTEYQPDLLIRERTPEGKWGREIAIEVEVDAKHPEQVRRNFEKNLLAGREVVFVVPNERVKRRVESILGEDAEYVKVEIRNI